MAFLTPYMLWGALAAGIPIALHFFFRSRYRTVPWAAMKFLLLSIEQTSRRLRFQELLLLAMRVLILAVLALALARPLTRVTGGAGRGEAVDAVLVFDVSYSMGAADGARSRLQRARDTALKIIDELPPHSTVQIVVCAGADRAQLLGPRSPANFDQARLLIQDIGLVHLASDLYPGVAEAAAVLARGQSSNKELFVFSDMQKLGWEQQAGALTRLLDEVRDKAAIYLVRCGTRSPRNVAVVGITPQAGVPRPGERVGFAVLVRNTGAEAVEKLTVSLTVDDDTAQDEPIKEGAAERLPDPKKTETTALAQVGPGETRAVALTGLLEKPGLHVLTARVKHDDVPGDNRFDQVILVREQVNVLIVDGAINEREPTKSASYFLENALSPVKESERGKYYLQPRVVSPRLVSPAHLGRADLCILVNAALPDELKRSDAVPEDFVEELKSFVRQGHGLVIFGGDKINPEAYNQLLGDDLLPMKIAGVMEFPAKSPLTMDRNSIGLPAFLRFKEDDYFKGFGKIETSKALDLAEVEKQDTPAKANGAAAGNDKKPLTVALRFSNGKPAVVAKKVGAGEVMLIAAAASPGYKAESPNPTWTDWQVRWGSIFVPFVDVTMSHLLQGQTQNHNLTAGETLLWHPAAKKEQAWVLLHPDGKQERLGVPTKANDRSVVKANDLLLAGVYRLQAKPAPHAQETEVELAPPTEELTPGIPLCVVPDLRESGSLETITDAEIDDMLGFSPIHVTASEEAGSVVAAERYQREWTLWLLGAVLALVLGETVLAWWCGRAW